MDWKKVRETLEKQLQLLSECSENCEDAMALAAMSSEMVAISRLLSGL